MNEEITQVKFSKEYDGQKVSVVCTLSEISSLARCWNCEFSKTSSLNIAHIVDIVVELFNSATLNADHLTLHCGERYLRVDKCAENNTYTHYLEELAYQVYI